MDISHAIESRQERVVLKQQHAAAYSEDDNSTVKVLLASSPRLPLFLCFLPAAFTFAHACVFALVVVGRPDRGYKPQTGQQYQTGTVASVESGRKVGLGLNLQRLSDGEVVVTNVIPGFGAIKVGSLMSGVNCALQSGYEISRAD